MHVRALRELVRLTLESILKEDDEEKQLRKWFKKPAHENSAEQALFKLGITPIQRLKNDELTSFLGAGQYAMAFEVLYKGKHAVAKVTNSMKDVVVLQELEHLRDSMPPEVARHVLKVYDVFELDYDVSEKEAFRDEDYYSSQKDTNGAFEPNPYESKSEDDSGSSRRRRDEEGKLFHVAIVEYLVPLPSSLKKEYWGTIELDDYSSDERLELKNSRAKHLLDDKEQLEKIIDYALKHEYIYKLMPEKAIKAFKSTLLNDDLSDVYSDKAGSVIARALNAHITRALKKINTGGKMLKQDIAPDVIGMFNMRLIRLLDKYIIGDRFPTYHSEERQLELAKNAPDKRIRDLIKALQYLKKNHGINWYDLHHNNVMMRPSTKELVISDPGLFDL